MLGKRTREDACEVVYAPASRWKAESWFHTDYNSDADRANAHSNSLQSALYLTATGAKEDSFVFYPGSHKQPLPAGSKRAHLKHRVMVENPQGTPCKVKTNPGDLVVWYSKVIHAGGFANLNETRKKKTDKEVEMWRVEKNKADTPGILQALDEHGVCVVPLATAAEVEALLGQFTADLNDIFRPELPFTSWTDAPFAGSGRGGSAIPPMTLSKGAWDAKLLPERVALFRRLLGADDICVSLDSVHWHPARGRLAVMASFAPKAQRSEIALKRKAVLAASGIWRTTHWAAFGKPSEFCYGGRFQRDKHFSCFSREWKAHAANTDSESYKAILSPALQNLNVSQVPGELQRIAENITLEQAREMVKDEIFKFL